MATALQQQLAAIAAKSTHELDHKAQRAGHSKSLLFESRQAASQNFDTIYQICFEGFNELCLLDNRFVAFNRTLFSEQSKTEDRSRLTSQQNQELDHVIERFLGLLTSKLLLAPAIKAAEWLVRRFKTHEYNTSLMLFAFLPYHSAQIFTTLLSIIPPQQLPPAFGFLRPYHTTAQLLPRHAVISAAGGSPALLTSFSDFVLGVAKVRHHSALLLGFWASVTAQAVNSMIDSTRSGRETIRKQREEDMLLRIKPILRSALDQKDIPELYLACCMIISILVTRATFQDNDMNDMMEDVVKGWSASTLEDGITCLAVIAEEREALSLPRRVTDGLLKCHDLLSILANVSKKCRVERLLIGLSFALVNRVPAEESVATLKSVLSLGNLSLAGLKMILKSAAAATCTDSDTVALTKSQREIIALLQGLASGEVIADIARGAIQEVEVEASRLGKHLAISLSEVPRRSESPQSEEDSELPLLKANGFSGDISALPTSSSSPASFLSPSMDTIFEPYAAHFQQTLDANMEFDSLLHLASASEHGKANVTECLSFLARLWCSNVTSSARAKAIRFAIDQLKSLSLANSESDYQGLLPYLIRALSDPSRSVRKIAIKLGETLRTFYDPLPTNGVHPSQPSTWRRKTLYGPKSLDVQFLSRDDVRKLLVEILDPIYEDCLLSDQRVVNSVADSMTATKASKPKRKSLDLNAHSNLAAFIASHSIATPLLSVRLGLLQILRNVGKAANAARVDIILPYARDALTMIPETPMLPSQLEEPKALLNILTHRTNEEIELLKSLADGTISTADDIQRLSFARLREIWPDLKQSSQIALIDWMLQLVHDPVLNVTISSEALASVHDIPLSTATLTHLLDTLPKSSEFREPQNSTSEQRSNKVAEYSKSSKADTPKLVAVLKRMTLVLELVDESKPEQHPQLIKALFNMLTEIHHFKILKDSQLIYLQGLVFDSLLAIINGLETASLPQVDRSVIRADLIVECARTTESTPVHRTALLLMSALASRFPDLVLHSVMPLFTFMSSSIMKQSDENSARVTEQTVASIIPPLAASLKKRGKDLVSGSSELLLSFVAAFEHIPLHRRTSLFKHLIQTLGPRDSLFAIVAMLIERYPDDPRAIPFVQELMNGFDTVIQLHAIKQYLDLVVDTMKTKRPLPEAIWDFSKKSPEEAKAITSNLLHGLASVLTGGSLQRKLRKVLKSSDDVVREIRSVYTQLLELGMEFKLRLDETSNLHAGTDRVLDALLSLMPTAYFIESSAMLMQSGTDEIRQQVFRSLEARVSQASHRSDQATVFIDVLPNCAVFLAASQPEATRHAAITCIDEISERFGKTNREAVFQVAEQVAGDAALGSTSEELRVISLLCLASMVEVLEDQIVPILPQTLRTMIGYLETQIMAKRPHASEALVNAAYGFASAVLDYVPWAISGDCLDRLIRISEEISVQELLTTEVPEAFCSLVAQKVPIRESLNAVHKNWSAAAASHIGAAELRLDILGNAVRLHTKAEISKNAQPVFDILLAAFDFHRTVHHSTRDTNLPDEESLSSFTEAINAVAMNVVLKSNDATFRPFFIRLVDWATTNTPKNDPNSTLYRCQSLYSFADTLLDQLKSLVTSYTAFFLPNATSLLPRLNPSKPLELNLLSLILQALTSSFRHDQDGFWQSPAHFDAIAEPLLRLLVRARDSLQLSDAATTAITELAAASGSQDHYKTINSLLMSFMRHEDAAVRLAAVKCERAISARLNLDWIALLPEMLPTISELQEDDDLDVEQETLRWVHQIEGITGESMEGMLQ